MIKKHIQNTGKYSTNYSSKIFFIVESFVSPCFEFGCFGTYFGILYKAKG